MKKLNILELFKNEFKVGDQVIVLHENCSMYFGRLVRFDGNEIAVGSNEYSWDEIVLIAHDGFPCRAFHSTLSLEQFEKLESWESMLLLYKTSGLELPFLNDKKPISEQVEVLRKTEPKEPEPVVVKRWGGGCPFQIENVEAKIINPFGGLRADYEETLFMRAPGGAVGMLWNIEYEMFELYV